MTDSALAETPIASANCSRVITGPNFNNNASHCAATAALFKSGLALCF
ncbi:MAG: hypothetical protein ACK5S2_13210 [Lysobacteraceae bacterium]